MAAWDLYVDESGSFDLLDGRSHNEYNLVGGYLIPHDKVSPQIASDWYDEMEVHFRGRNFNVRDFDVRNRDCFNLRHASENQESETCPPVHIAIMQLTVLNWYARRIKEAGGYIVTFEVPRAQVNDFDAADDVGLDRNTINYLTIIARGIIRLCNDLISRINDNAPEVYLYIAQRKDVSRGHGTIPLDQYKQMITQIVRANASWLTEDEFFTTIMEKPNHFQIVPDGQDPRIIPCDWICNTYWRADTDTYSALARSPIYNGVYLNNPKRIQFVTTQMSDLDEPYFNDMLRSRNYSQIFFRLLQDGCDRNPHTAEFFDRMNKVDIIDQRLFARHVPEHYDLFVRNYTKLRINKATTVERELNEILSILKKDDSTDRLKNAEISNLLKARVLVHLFHIHIHQSNERKIWQRANEIAELLNKLPDSEDKAEIKLRFFNREIVALTDSFDYVRATEVFQTLDQYWTKHLAAQRQLLALPTDASEDVVPQSGSPDKTTMSTEWGEEIGSYIQVFTHRLPTVDDKKKKALYNEIMPRFRIYLESFSDAEQWGRSYQYLCDLEAEMGHYDISFAYLVRAVCGTSPFEKKVPIESWNIDEEEKINPINCGRIANQIKSHEKAWEFEHYLRLGAEIAYVKLQKYEGNYNDGEILFQALRGHIGANAEIVKLLEEIEGGYLRAISLRNFARMTAAFDDGHGTDSYYKNASNAISSDIDERLDLRMIYVSIMLERAAHLLRIQGWVPAKKVMEAAQRHLNIVHQAFVDQVVQGTDPFPSDVNELVETVMEKLERSINGEADETEFRALAGNLMNAAKRIPY